MGLGVCGFPVMSSILVTMIIHESAALAASAGQQGGRTATGAQQGALVTTNRTNRIHAVVILPSLSKNWSQEDSSCNQPHTGVCNRVALGCQICCIFMDKLLLECELHQG